MKLPQFFVTKKTPADPLLRTRTPLGYLATAVLLVQLTGCDALKQPEVDTTLTAEQIATLMPNRGQQKSAWASDIYDIFNTLKIERNEQNICSVIAVIDQESNFKADPPVPNLGKSSLKELNSELDEKLGKTLAPYFRTMLTQEPTPQNSFETQILKVKTEQQLDKLYHQMFSYFSDKYYASRITNVTKLLGGDFAERLDPITTLGSMQVHINYARDHRRTSGNNEELRRDLYTQYGGLYYGIHRLMLYPASYSSPLYRFADYNSGMYSSRNAGFQKMLAELTGQKLDFDGDLLIYKKGNTAVQSQSEKALLQLVQQGAITLTPKQIHTDLTREKAADFVNTATYNAITTLYKAKTGKPPIAAMMPQVVISGAKLSKDYNTKWYADNVNKRYLACMNKAKPKAQ